MAGGRSTEERLSSGVHLFQAFSVHALVQPFIVLAVCLYFLTDLIFPESPASTQKSFLGGSRLKVGVERLGGLVKTLLVLESGLRQVEFHRILSVEALLDFRLPRLVSGSSLPLLRVNSTAVFAGEGYNVKQFQFRLGSLHLVLTQNRAGEIDFCSVPRFVEGSPGERSFDAAWNFSGFVESMLLPALDLVQLNRLGLKEISVEQHL